jgi:hypothetical protein
MDLTKIKDVIVEGMRNKLYSITSLQEELINLLNLDIDDLISLCKTSKKMRNLILNSSHIKVNHRVYYRPLYRNYIKLLPKVRAQTKYVNEIIKAGVVQDLKIRDYHTKELYFDLQIPSSLHSLDLESVTFKGDFSVFHNIKTLNLSFTDVKDVSVFGGVHTLKLSGTLVVDVSALGGVHTLYLSDSGSRCFYAWRSTYSLSF